MDVENDTVERKGRTDCFVDVDVEARTESGCFQARKTMMVTSVVCELMSFPASPHERLALQVILEYSQIYSGALSDSKPTHSWRILRLSTNRASITASSSDQTVSRFVIVLRNALTSPLVLRCDCGLRPNVATHTGPRKVHKSPPRNPRRHSGMVACHETGFPDDAFHGVSTTVCCAAKQESHPGNLCGYGRNAFQQQRRVCDEQSHQNLGESPHQVSNTKGEYLLLLTAIVPVPVPLPSLLPSSYP